MKPLYVPSDQLMEATADPSWLYHWRTTAQNRLARKRSENRETIGLRLEIALIDRVLIDNGLWPLVEDEEPVVYYRGAVATKDVLPDGETP